MVRAVDASWRAADVAIRVWLVPPVVGFGAFMFLVRRDIDLNWSIGLGAYMTLNMLIGSILFNLTSIPVLANGIGAYPRRQRRLAVIGNIVIFGMLAVGALLVGAAPHAS